MYRASETAAKSDAYTSTQTVSDPFSTLVYVEKRGFFPFYLTSGDTFHLNTWSSCLELGAKTTYFDDKTAHEKGLKPCPVCIKSIVVMEKDPYTLEYHLKGCSKIEEIKIKENIHQLDLSLRSCAAFDGRIY
jgi:hypothetical protein